MSAERKSPTLDDIRAQNDKIEEIANAAEQEGRDMSTIHQEISELIGSTESFELRMDPNNGALIPASELKQSQDNDEERSAAKAGANR